MLTLRGGDFIGQTLPAKFQAIWARESGGGGGGRRGAGGDGGGGLRDLRTRRGRGRAGGRPENRRLPSEEYREKGRRGRLYFERNFTRERFMERLDELLRQLTGGKGGDTVNIWQINVVGGSGSTGRLAAGIDQALRERGHRGTLALAGEKRPRQPKLPSGFPGDGGGACAAYG